MPPDTLPARTALGAPQVLTTNGLTPAPTSLVTGSHGGDFFVCFPGCKSSSKGNVLPTWKRWHKARQKHREAATWTRPEPALSAASVLWTEE